MAQEAHLIFKEWLYADFHCYKQWYSELVEKTTTTTKTSLYKTKTLLTERISLSSKFLVLITGTIIKSYAIWYLTNLSPV